MIERRFDALAFTSCLVGDLDATRASPAQSDCGPWGLRPLLSQVLPKPPWIKCSRRFRKVRSASRIWGSLQSSPDGHPKLLHLWPVKLLQAGRTDGDYTGVAVMREAASFNR